MSAASSPSIIVIDEHSVYEALKKHEAGITAKDLAIQMVGPTGRKTALNSILYHLKSKKKAVCVGQPPVWTATDNKVVEFDGIYGKWSLAILFKLREAVGGTMNRVDLRTQIHKSEGQDSVFGRVLIRMMEDNLISLVGDAAIITEKGTQKVQARVGLDEGVLAYLTERTVDGHGTTVTQLVEHLRPGLDPKSEEYKKVKTEINSTLYTDLRAGKVSRQIEPDSTIPYWKVVAGTSVVTPIASSST